MLCTIGSYISGSENWGYSLFFMACAIAMFVYTIVLQKNMWVILYWEGGLLFMDRGGNIKQHGLTVENSDKNPNT